MNTTSCPPGRASDYVPGGGWPASPSQPSCELDTSTVFALLAFLIFLRVITVLLLIYRENKKNLYLRSQPGRAHLIHRVPLIPLLACFTTVTFICYAAAIATEAMYSNGWTFAIFALGNTTLIFNAGLHLRKILNLTVKLSGTKIVHVTDLDAANQRGAKEYFFIFTLCCVAVQFATIVAGLAMPHSHIPQAAQMLSLAIFLFGYSSSFFLYQHKALAQLWQLRKNANPSAIIVIDRQRKRCRREQLIIPSICFIASTLGVVQAFAPTFWINYVLCIFEAITVVIVLALQFASSLVRGRVPTTRYKTRTRSFTYAGSFVEMISKARLEQANGQVLSQGNPPEAIPEDSVYDNNIVSQTAAEPSTTQQASNQRFMLRKQNNDVLEEVTLQVVLDQTNGADVVEDKNDADVSILTTHTCAWSNSNTVFVRIFKFVPERFLRLLSMTDSPMIVSAFVLAFTAIPTVLMAIVISGLVPREVAIAQLSVFFVTYGVLAAVVDYNVASRIVVTPWYMVRQLTNLLAVAFLCDILRDIRIIVAISLLSGGQIAYLLDAFIPAVSSSKIAVCISHLTVTVVVSILLQFDLVHSSNNHVLHFTPTATYSLYQLSRDLFLSTAAFAAFELYDLLKRKRNSSRLAHVGNPVTKLVKPYDAAATANLAHSPTRIARAMRPDHPHSPVGASKVVIRDGFFMHQDDVSSFNGGEVNEASPIIQRVVVLDSVIMKEVDSLACVVFGVERGIPILRLFTERFLILTIGGPSFTLVALINVIGGFAPVELSFGALPLTFFWVLRHFLTLNRSVLMLLLKRGEFWVPQFFLLVWLVLILVVLPHDSRLCIIFFALFHAIFESVDDAHLSMKRSGVIKVVRILENLIVGSIFVLLGASLLLRLPQVLGEAATASYVVNFRPDLTALYVNRSMAGVGNEVDFSDEPAVLDVIQSTGDLTLSIGLRYFFDTLLRIWNGSHNQFVSVHAPVRKILMGSKRVQDSSGKKSSR